MLVIVNPTMPSKFRNRLLSDFSIIFPTFEDVDSQAQGFFFHQFASIHLTWYNRYSTKVLSSFFFFFQ